VRATGCGFTVDHGERVTPGLLFDPIDGCALCGLVQFGHPAEVHGLGHLHDHASGRRGYVAPSDELRAAREGARLRDGYRIAGFDSVTGRPNTHLVATTCTCGATALATPERVEGALCGDCMRKGAPRLTEIVL
jgi:hypothetical protein